MEIDLASWWCLPVALALGALHALEPGHAKTLTAAYLIGIRGTVRDAIVLGTAIAITHSSIVIALVAAALAIGTTLYGSPEAFAAAMGHGLDVSCAMIVIVIGVLMIVHRIRRARAIASHAAWHAEHGHDADHHHDHDDHGHRHDLPEYAARGERPTFGQLVTFGIAGGMLPCPASVSVLLLALATGRTGLGLLTVGGFSVGLALALVAIGILVVVGLDRLTSHRRFAAWSARAPILSALMVVAAGAFTLARSYLG
jgi:nickel/cobalt transporter (NicO) family protein